MTCKKWLLHKICGVKIVTICALSITLSLTEAALAGYQPPRDQKPPSGYTDSSGIRGVCKAFNAQSLTLLAPLSHVGRTTSSHPTFAWFVPNHKRLPIEFTLYELTSNDQLKLAYKSQLQSSPGIMSLSLPQDVPSLTVGRRYLWQVEVLCDRNRPSRNLLAGAELEVVGMPTELKNALAQGGNRSNNARLYAKAGIWYDAFAEALASKSQGEGELGKVAAALLQDLAKIETSAKGGNLSQLAFGEDAIKAN